MNINTSIIACTAAAAVAVLSAATTLLVKPPEPAPTPPDPRLAAVEQGIATLGRELETLRATVRQLADQPSVGAQRRLATGEPAEAAAGTASPAARPTAGADGKAKEPRPEAAERAGFRKALAQMFRNGTSDPKLGDEEQAQFWRLARTTGIVDELIAELEQITASSPRDVQARMELADAYTAKLLTIPGGPEQGVWGGKAERQWQAVLEQQPDHWEARFALGFNYSMYPSFVDKSKEAILHLEIAKKQLAALPVEPRQVETYTALARMYARQHKKELAGMVLAEGLQRFPDDERLLRARELAGTGEKR